MARTVEVKLIGDSASMERAFKSAGSAADSFGSSLGGKLGSGLKLAAKAAAAAGVALGAGFAATVTVGVKSLIEHEKALAQTNAVLKSTGGAANVTAKDVTNLADSIEKMSGIDDVAVQAGENLLLTFKNIRNEAGKGNDIFNQSTEILADMSVAMGTDMSSSAIQLGKALNDPIKGITALTRVGVTFTDAQKEQIKALVEAGDVMGAQKIILKELTSEFGGSAAALGDTFAGKVQILKARFEEMAEAIASKVMPFAERFVDFLGHVAEADSFGEAISRFVSGLKSLGTDIATAVGDAVSGVDWAAVWGDVSGFVSGLATRLRNVDWANVGATVVNALGTALGAVPWGDVAGGIVTFAANLLTAVIGAIRAIDWSAVGRAVLDLVKGALKAAFGAGANLAEALGLGGLKDIVGGVTAALAGLVIANTAAGAVGALAGAFGKLKTILQGLAFTNIASGLSGIATNAGAGGAAGAVGRLAAVAPVLKFVGVAGIIAGVAAGLGALAGKAIDAASGVNDLKDAVERARAAADALKGSASNLTQANLRWRDATNQVEQAQLNLKTAQAEVNRLVGEGKTKGDAYQQAQLNLKTATVDLDRAEVSLADAQADLVAKTREHTQASNTNADALVDVYTNMDTAKGSASGLGGELVFLRGKVDQAVGGLENATTGFRHVTDAAAEAEGAIRDIPQTWKTTFNQSGAGALKQAAVEIKNLVDVIPAYKNVTFTVTTNYVETGIRPPNLQHGTPSFRGGLAVVGEVGPELVALPKGARVFPTARTRRLLANMPDMGGYGKASRPMPRPAPVALADVGGGGPGGLTWTGDLHLHVAGSVLTKADLVREVRDGLVKIGKNSGTALGRYA